MSGLTRAGSTLALLGTILVGLLAMAPGASAITQSDQEAIAHLRQLFGVQPQQASDTELASVLDSHAIGPSIRGDVDCAVLGAEALHNTAVDHAIAQALESEINLILSSDPIADSIIAVVSARLPTPLGFLLTVHHQLVGFASEVHAFTTAISTVMNQHTYRELLVLVNGLIEEGLTPEEAGEAVTQEYAPLLTAAHQLSHLPESTLLQQDEFTAGCMALAQNGSDRAGYGLYVAELVADMRSYSEHGGTTAGGLTIIETSPGLVQVVNNGRAPVEAISINGISRQLARIAALDPGESEQTSLAGGEAPEHVVFEVDGVEGIERSYTQETASFYAGQAEALPLASPPRTLHLTLTSGPFFATGVSHSVKWEPGDGTTFNTTPLTHTYACYGESDAVFTAEAAGQKLSRAVNALRAPPFTLDWTTSEGGYVAVPGLPDTFRADASIPETATVAWDFGDGQHETGHEVHHTYTSALEAKVTMSVTLAGASCPPLPVTHTVVVGRSEEWLSLPSVIGTMQLSPHVAGYIISGSTRVPVGHTLTVPAGVNVKFVRANGEPGQLVVEGALRVHGSTGAPATFTSRYDDTAGGHCSCSGAGQAPAAGDWYGLTIKGSATLEHAAVRYASHAIDMQSSGAQLTVSQSTLTDSVIGLFSAGVNAINLTDSTVARDSQAVQLECFFCAYTPQILNDTFESDPAGIWARDGAAPRIDGATFSGTSSYVAIEPYSARTLVTNTHTPGAYISMSSGKFPPGASRLSSELPYVINGEVNVPKTSQLSLAPGTVLRFARQSPSEPGVLGVSGVLLAQGTAAAPATLTSLYDETAGGPCSCVVHPQAPAAGDWYGLRVEAEGNVVLGQTSIRYPAVALRMESPNASLQMVSSSISSAVGGVEAATASPIQVESSTFREVQTALALKGPASATVLNSSFPGTKLDAYLTTGAQLAIHGSTFQAGQEGIDAIEGAHADATYDWWGSIDGPRPSGSGASIAGNVTASPYCANDGCAQLALSLSPSGILSDGGATSTATVTVTRSGQPQIGDHLTLSSSDPTETISPVTDNGDGTYTATVTASHTNGASAITASDESVAPATQASAPLLQGPARQLKLKLKGSVTAGGSAPAIATVTVTAARTPVAGDQLVFSSPDAAVAFGAVTDHGNGTYTAPVTPSGAVGDVAVTATDVTISPHASAFVMLKQKAPKLQVKIKPAAIAADGVSTATVTIKANLGKGGGPTQQIEVHSSDPDEILGPVKDDGNGAYTVTVTASLKPGPATITATDSSIMPELSASATLTQH